jgi:hypothetical protein
MGEEVELAAHAFRVDGILTGIQIALVTIFPVSNA